MAPGHQLKIVTIKHKWTPDLKFPEQTNQLIQAQFNLVYFTKIVKQLGPLLVNASKTHEKNVNCSPKRI